MLIAGADGRERPWFAIDFEYQLLRRSRNQIAELAEFEDFLYALDDRSMLFTREDIIGLWTAYRIELEDEPGPTGSPRVDVPSVRRAIGELTMGRNQHDWYWRMELIPSHSL